MNEQVAGWEIDPYDNYKDVREEMNRGRAPAMPQYQQQGVAQQMPQHYVEQVVDDVYEEVQEQDMVSEAVARIEQAKLYETLLKHDLLAVGSARPEILNKVQSEIKSYVLDRLETLLGMRQEKITVTKMESQFDDEEVMALKALASKVMRRDPQPIQQPTIRPLGAQAPTQAPIVQPLQAPIGAKVSSMVERPQAKVKAKAKMPSKEAPIDLNTVTPEQAAELVAQRSVGRKRAAAAPRAIPMPSVEQMNQQIAQQVATSNLGNGILGKAISQSLGAK